jgi:hypothetical protein
VRPLAQRQLTERSWHQFMLSIITRTSCILRLALISGRPQMKNVTITLDERTAAWARVYAAQQGKSVSRLLGEILQERMRELRDYDEAMRRYLAKKAVKFEWIGGQRPSREELHERAGLR